MSTAIILAAYELCAQLADEVAEEAEADQILGPANYTLVRNEGKAFAARQIAQKIRDTIKLVDRHATTG